MAEPPSRTTRAGIVRDPRPLRQRDSSGVGYDGSDPDGNVDPTGETAWAYATSMVEIKLGRATLLPGAGEIAAAIDRSTNLAEWRAERPVAAFSGRMLPRRNPCGRVRHVLHSDRIVDVAPILTASASRRGCCGATVSPEPEPEPEPEPSFSPDDLEGLVLWLDFDTAESLTLFEDQWIMGVADLSGGSNDFEEGETGGPERVPGVSQRPRGRGFNTNDEWLRCTTSLALVQPFTVVTVVMFDGTFGDVLAVLSGGVDGGGVGYHPVNGGSWKLDLGGAAFPADTFAVDGGSRTRSSPRRTARDPRSVG